MMPDTYSVSASVYVAVTKTPDYLNEGESTPLIEALELMNQANTRAVERLKSLAASGWDVAYTEQDEDITYFRADKSFATAHLAFSDAELCGCAGCGIEFNEDGDIIEVPYDYSSVVVA
jgi:hypothetical protein